MRNFSYENLISTTCSATFNPAFIHQAVCLTGESPLRQKFLCRPIEHKDLEGVFLTRVQSCHRRPAPRSGQHQLWLRHLWNTQAFWFRNTRITSEKISNQHQIGIQWKKTNSLISCVYTQDIRL